MQMRIPQVALAFLLATTASAETYAPWYGNTGDVTVESNATYDRSFPMPAGSGEVDSIEFGHVLYPRTAKALVRVWVSGDNCLAFAWDSYASRETVAQKGPLKVEGSLPQLCLRFRIENEGDEPITARANIRVWLER